MTIKVQVTSANTSILEKLSSMPMLLDLKLSKSVSMPLASTIDDLITGNSEGVFKKKTLLRGERTTFFVGDASSMPKEASAGDLLIGTMDLSSIKLDGPLYRVSYLVPPEAAKASSNSTPENKKEEPELLKEAVRDLEISWLKKIKSDEFKATLLARLEKENPNFIPVHRFHLESLFTKLDKLEGAETQEHADLCRQTIKVADQILAIVNVSDLAMYFGVHHENETPEEKETAKNKGTEKDALVYALVSKTHALRDLLQIKDGLKLDLAESESNASFDASLNLLSQWVGDEPTTHGRYLLLWTWSQQQKGYYATALKAVQKYLSDSKKGAGSPDSEEAIVWKKVSGLKVKLYEQLDWKLWVDYEKRWEQVKFPKTFAKF